VFMEKMYSEIGDTCPLCEKLREEINQVRIFDGPRDLFLTVDYVYFPEQEVFERADRIAAWFKQEISSKSNRPSIDTFLSSPYFNIDNSIFNKFVIMNAIIGTTDLLPTIFTIYKDNTYDLDMFQSNIKTTFYRKINETARKIINEEVKEVFIMSTYVTLRYNEHLLFMTSKERLQEETKDILAFMKVDYLLNEEECVFEEEDLTKIENIIHVVKNRKQRKLNIGTVNMSPIVEAFKVHNLKE